jgi:hypothetical protein
MKEAASVSGLFVHEPTTLNGSHVSEKQAAGCLSEKPILALPGRNCPASTLSKLEQPKIYN